MVNLVEGLTNEILRCTEIYKIYIELANENTGFQKNIIWIVAQLILKDINEAKAAQASGDVLRMIPAFKTLQEIKE